MEFSTRHGCLFLVFVFSCLIISECGEVFNMTSLLESKLKELRHMDLADFNANPDDNSIPNGFCKTWIGTVVAENTTWEEQHCRRCRCDGHLGAVCTHPPCDIAFHPYLENNCEEWSSDNCCCLRSTCVHDGVRYAANDWFLLTPSDPCTRCKCDPSDGLPQCVEIQCPTTQCVDASFVPGQCCPICLQGHNCRVPALPVPEGDTIADVTPILHENSRLVNSTLDPSLVWNCTCINTGSDATCDLLGTTNNDTVTIL